MIYKSKWFGELIQQEYQECIDVNKALIGSLGQEFKLEYYPTNQDDLRQASVLKDVWALDQLIADDCVIMDCDLMLKSLPNFDNDGAYTIYECGRPSPAMMASKGDAGREWWKARLENKKSRGITDCYGFFNKLFRPEWLVKDGLPIEIPAECYDHKRFVSEAEKWRLKKITSTTIQTQTVAQSPLQTLFSDLPISE